ncbi:hypothetical protein [Thermococcus sp.]
MLDVEPPDYYPVIDKLFADELEDALWPFGITVREMRVRVEPLEKVLTLHFDILLEREEGFPLPNVEAIVLGILDKLTEEATSTFGRLYGVSFRVGRVNIKERIIRKQNPGNPTLIVEGPSELKPVLARVGKGLIIKMKEWGYSPSTVTLSFDNEAVSIAVKMTSRLNTYDKLTLKSALVEKAAAHLKTLLGRRFPVEVRILDPSDRVIKVLERNKRTIEERIQELLSNEDVKALMDALGRKPP